MQASEGGINKKLMEILTIGGIVTLPAAIAFTGAFLMTYYTEKELVHLMRKRKFLLPSLVATAAGASVSVFIASKWLPGFGQS